MDATPSSRSISSRARANAQKIFLAFHFARLVSRQSLLWAPQPLPLLGFLPGQLVFDGNGHVYSSSGTRAVSSGPDPALAARSVNVLSPVTHQLASYNLQPFGNALVYGIGYPAAAAVAAPVVGAAGMAALANPYYTAGAGLAFQQFISPSGPGANWWEIGGAILHQFVVETYPDPPFGP